MVALRTLRPPPGPPVLTAGREAAGPGGGQNVPESARAQQLRLWDRRGGEEGGRGPPAPVTAGGPAPEPGVRASPPPRGRRPLLGLLRWRAQPNTFARCADPGPAPAPARLGAGRGLLRTAAAAAAATGGRREREREREEGKGGGRGRGRGRDESPRGEGAAAQPLPQRPGSRPLHRPLPVAQGPRLRAWGAWSGCPTPPDSGEPQCWSLGEVTLRVTRGFGERFEGRASDFKLWRSSPWDLEGNLAGTSK